jgi:hypothetical protein
MMRTAEISKMLADRQTTTLCQQQKLKIQASNQQHSWQVNKQSTCSFNVTAALSST